MLAVILENCYQREQLENKNMELEIEVQNKLRELQIGNKELLQEIEQKNSIEIDLRESEKRFRELAENIEVVFWIVENKSLLYINSIYEEWALINRAFNDVVSL